MTTPTITFRAITPLHNFTLWTERDGGFHRGGSFHESGMFEKTPYTVRIVRALGEELSALVLSADNEHIISDLVLPDTGVPFEDYYLVADVVTPATEETAVSSNTMELLRVNQAFLEAMHVHAKGGLIVSDTFWLKSPASHSGSMNRSRGLGAGRPNGFLFGPTSIFDGGYPGLAESFRLFLSEPWGESQFGRVLELAMNSMRLHGCCGTREHAFLLLMVAFEAMFKASTENSDRAAKRIAEFLCTSSRAKKKVVQKAFTTAGTGFRDLRNSVAHGDLPACNLKSSLPKLRGLMQGAIVRLLLHYQASPPAEDDDYYDWLDTAQDTGHTVSDSMSPTSDR